MVRKKLLKHRKYAKILNVMERIVTSFILYFGGILISVCGFILLFSTTEAMEIIGLKFGVSGLLLVMASSFLDNIVGGLTKVNDQKIKSIDQVLKERKENSYKESKTITKEETYSNSNLMKNESYLREEDLKEKVKVRKLTK